MDINNFGPFSSDTYGTVIDFLVLIATILATIAVYKTLDSQVKINRYALETSRISLRPYFTQQYLQGGTVTLTCNNAHALNLRADKVPSINKEVLDMKFVFIGDKINTGIELDFRMVNGIAHEGNVLIEIFFQDEVGRDYKQQFIKSGSSVTISHPLLIS